MSGKMMLTYYFNSVPNTSTYYFNSVPNNSKVVFVSVSYSLSFHVLVPLMIGRAWIFV